MTVIAWFLSSNRGLVTVKKKENADSPTGLRYVADWTDDYLFTMRLFGTKTFNSYGDIITALRKWDPSIKEITDWKEIDLYIRHDRGYSVVSIRPEYGCSLPIKARSVSVNTQLMPTAVGFFKYWLGDDAVQDEKLIRQG